MNIVHLQVKQLDPVTTEIEMEGSVKEIATMLCNAMALDQELAQVVLSSITSFLDITGRSREKFAELILAAPGQREGPES